MKKTVAVRIFKTYGARRGYSVTIPNEGTKPFWIKSEALKYARRMAKNLNLEVKDETK